MHTPPLWAKWIISAALIALAILSWSRHLDDAANTATLDNFKRALAVAAIARGFNGVISVAQGTEVAVQPVGIGVTLTIGEILDPLNDLIERFSALALLASVSLGLQLTLGQMVTSPWLSGLLSIAMLAYLILLWRPALGGPGKLSQRLLQALSLVIFLRFLLAVMLLLTHVIDQTFLAAKQDAAVASLSAASTSIEQLQQQPTETQVNAEEGGFFDRTGAQIRDFLDASSQTLDLKQQLAEVESQVENSVEEIVNLIVIFLLQTLLLPVASLWLCAWAFRVFLRSVSSST